MVDRNHDDRLQDVIEEFAFRVPVLRISSPKGVSRARNKGLQKASGEIIAFPDDDCWYSQGLLLEVIDRWFRDHPLILDSRSRCGRRGRCSQWEPVVAVVL